VEIKYSIIIDPYKTERYYRFVSFNPKTFKQSILWFTSSKVV